jgi:hypothetical protein
LADFLDRVGSAWYSQDPDLGSGVECRQGVVPAPFQGRAHRHRLGVARHDRDHAVGGGAPAQLADQRPGVVEVSEYAVAEHRGEAPAVHRLFGVLAVGLQERHPSLGLGGQPRQVLLCLVQHRPRRVKQRHVVAGPGQRKRLVARAAADVEHGRRGRRQVLKQLVVHHVGAHVALHRGISLVGELVSQTGPGVIVHDTKLQVSS